jgi:hypothetical protein
MAEYFLSEEALEKLQDDIIGMIAARELLEEAMPEFFASFSNVRHNLESLCRCLEELLAWRALYPDTVIELRYEAPYGQDTGLQ